MRQLSHTSAAASCAVHSRRQLWRQLGWGGRGGVGRVLRPGSGLAGGVLGASSGAPAWSERLPQQGGGPARRGAHTVRAGDAQWWLVVCESASQSLCSYCDSFLNDFSGCLSF